LNLSNGTTNNKTNDYGLQPVRALRANEMSDYFEHYDKLPKEIQDLSDWMFEEQHPRYDNLKKWKERFERFGWTFSYGLDGEPFNLRPNILTT